MTENKFEKLLGECYTDNSIVNYLVYWMKGNTTYPTDKVVYGKDWEYLSRDERRVLRIKQETWRKENELDVIWLGGDLHADTIFSVWMPLKMVLECLNPEEKFYKAAFGKNPNKYLKKILEHIDDYLPREDELVAELYKFSELATTRANVMRLKERQMQSRGAYYDQMPKTLYECFDDGRFSQCFGTDDKVREWIKAEKLEMFFDGGIEKKKIKPLISGLDASKWERLTDKNELLEMLRNFNDILLARQAYFV